LVVLMCSGSFFNFFEIALGTSAASLAGPTNGDEPDVTPADSTSAATGFGCHLRAVPRPAHRIASPRIRWD
jgi:hypothetical protein